jgi:invasion protein IalB
MVHTAFGIFLPAGVTLTVDGGGPTKFDLQMCDANGCYAGAPLSDDVLASMKGGEELNLAFQDMQKQSISVPMSLGGFAAAYEKIE